MAEIWYQGTGLDISDPAQAEAFLYGEPDYEDDCLCDRHGCRLAYLKGHGWRCMQCIAEDREAEAEFYRLWNERLDREFLDDPANHSTCRQGRGDGYVAFQCTMPWWA